MENHEIESMLEGILFASGEPVSMDRLCTALSLSPESLTKAADRLSDLCRFERRGIRLIRVENSLQLVSAPEYADVIRAVLEERKPPPLSTASLETLAIIAYYQPTTRAYIEQVRGIDSSNTVNTLCEKGLIEECGRLEVPGRPIQYRTTLAFLRSFGISSLDELPDIQSSQDEVEGQLSLK